MKIILWIVLLIWAAFELIQSTKRYRKDKGKMDLISLIASIIMLPAGTILLISEIISK
jgi:hypothetical protein